MIINEKYRFLTDHGQQTGLSHVWGKQNCQDVIIVRESDSLAIFGLADGQSSKSMSDIGGRAVLNRIAAFIEKTGIEAMESYRYIDELAFKIMKTTRECLHETAEAHHVEVNQLSSTIIIMAIDKLSVMYRK